VTGPLMAFQFYNLFTWNGLLLLIIDYVWYQGFWYLAMFEWITVFINLIVGNIDWFNSDFGYLNWYDPNKGKTPEEIAAEQKAKEEAERDDEDSGEEESSETTPSDETAEPGEGEPTDEESLPTDEGTPAEPITDPTTPPTNTDPTVDPDLTENPEDSPSTDPV